MSTGKLLLLVALVCFILAAVFSFFVLPVSPIALIAIGLALQCAQKLFSVT